MNVCIKLFTCITLGSYDHTVKMWDNRSPATVMTINHGHPVEDILVFPSGGLCASAGKQKFQVIISKIG